MVKRYFKLIIWALLLLIATGISWGAISGIANLLAYFERGADPASALNIVPNIPPDLAVKRDWLPDDADTGRKLEPFTRTQIEGAYLRAWLQWNLSLLRGEPYGLKTYFVGPALASVSNSISDAKTHGWRVAQADTMHQLRLHFYSADGSIVAFTDQNALVAQLIRDAAGDVVFTGDTRSTYAVVMLLEDGNWRVRHLVRTEGADLVAPTSGSALAPAGFITRSGDALALDGQPYRIAGVNYYPQRSPWDYFWPQYNTQIIDQDFAIIHSLGLNTVRVFIPFEQFGGAHVDPIFLMRLADLLDRADTHGLKVIVTLFDFRADYRMLLWPEADRHLETLLTRFADHRAILAWDLKNEPDLDYTAAGRETVNAWLGHTSRLARLYDPNHLITIGWSAPAAAHTLTESVDLVSFHYYAPPSSLPASYIALRAAAPDRPILLGEFGLPTWNSFVFPNGHNEAEQAAYYADTLSMLRAADSAGYLAWTLYDFSYVPQTVAGRWPWQTGPQRQLGLFRADGVPKPAAALLAPGANLDIPRPPAWARFLKPFWLTMMFIPLALMLAGRMFFKR